MQESVENKKLMLKYRRRWLLAYIMYECRLKIHKQLFLDFNAPAMLITFEIFQDQDQYCKRNMHVVHTLLVTFEIFQDQDQY